MSNLMAMLFVLFFSSDVVAAGFTDNGDGTVTDGNTRLIWQKEDDNTTRPWKAAVSHCESLSLAGKSDWRLPGKEELTSITGKDIQKRTIDITFFPNTKSSRYWSSTAYENKKSYAWVVFFNHGGVYGDFKSYNYYARCVRGGQ